MEYLFRALGLDPEYPSIHIAGTNGKGSTSSLIAAVLKEAGYSVGLHTTPHLQTPRERFQINGQLPSEEVFALHVERAYRAILEIEANHSFGAFTNQELMFATGMDYFQRQGVDIAVIETFMGGQYDATNIIRPLVSVITNVELDHTGILGKTISSIAMVKAGVIKPQTPFITGATQPEAIQLFKQRCQDMKTECIVVGEENKYRARQLGLKGSLLSAEVLNNLFADLRIGLVGRYQINNAILCLYIAQVLRARGWLIADQAIRDGFERAFIPGRFEIVEHQPLIILDGAHNPAKTRALAHSLRPVLKNQKAIFVFAMKKGKNWEESLRPLIPLAAKFIVTRFSAKKSRSTTVIHRYLKAQGIPVATRLDPQAAIALAKRQVRPNQYICVTGSLYLVGKIRNQWHPYGSHEPEALDLEQDTNRTIGEPRVHKKAALSPKS